MNINEQRIKAMVVMNIIDNCTIELDNTGQERYSLDGNQFGKVVDALVKNIKVMPRFSDEEIEDDYDWEYCPNCGSDSIVYEGTESVLFLECFQCDHNWIP